MIENGTAWRDLAQELLNKSEPPLVYIVGEPDTGKTTLASIQIGAISLDPELVGNDRINDLDAELSDRHAS